MEGKESEVKMSIVQGRYGSSRKYNVQMVGDTLPENKLILVLDGSRGSAFVVSDYRTSKYRTNEETGEHLYEYQLSPIKRLDTQHGMPDLAWHTAEEILTNEDYEVLFLDSLEDIGDIKNGYVYD